MSDEEDGRLLIDDIHDTSGGEPGGKKENLSDPSIPIVAPQVSVADSLKIENPSPADKIEDDTENIDRLDVKNSLAESNSLPRNNGTGFCFKRSSASPNIDDVHFNKKCKQVVHQTSTLPQRNDRTTCVHSRAVQSECDESPFNLEPGASFVLQMTVLCRLEGTNTLYVSAKWKDHDISGILTDGEPPGFHVYAKKRLASNGLGFVGSSADGEKGTPVSTPSKKRIGRGGQTCDTKKRGTPVRADTAIPEDDDDLDVTGIVEGKPTPDRDTSTIFLTELPAGKLVHTCKFDGCFHQYDRLSELDYHINIVHKDKSIVSESICTQTDMSYFRTSHMSSMTENQTNRLTSQENDSIEQLMKAGVPSSEMGVKVENESLPTEPKSPGVFSDISDDTAPQLQKEEPHSSATSVSSSVVTPKKMSVCIPKPGTANSELPPTCSQPLITSTIVNSTSTASCSANSDTNLPPSAVVPPISASPRAFGAPVGVNGGFVPGYPQPMQFMPPFTSPLNGRLASSPASRDHKINQLKSDGASVSDTSSVASSTPKQLSSPAQQRSFNLPPVQGFSPAQQQMAHLQQQAMQQMYMQQMGLSGRGFPAMSVSGPSVDQMTQMAAMQAAVMGGSQSQFTGMFPK